MKKQNKTEQLKNDDALKRRRASLFKIGAVMILAFIVWVFSSIAWFSMSKENNASGMGGKAGGMPYIIQTRSESGTYSNIYESLETGGAEWKISSNYNFDNHESAISEGETEPGIEPGNEGKLEFRVNPNNADSITVDCIFDIKAYIETTENDDDEEEEPVTVITELGNGPLLDYINAHVLLFAGKDQSGKYTDFIGCDESLRRVLANQTYTKDDDAYTTIYWVWPMHLSALTSNDVSTLIYDPSQRNAVITYIADKKDGFFKDCTDSKSQVTDDLTALASSNSYTVYNHYNRKYDNADLEIGNNVSYVLLSMKVE